MKKVLGWIVIVICAAGFIVASIKLGSILNEYKKARDYYNQMASQMVTYSAKQTPDTKKPEAGEVAEVTETTEEEQVPLTPPISVDFDALKAINSDVVGWIYCEGTMLNYPVLQGDDNNYYLHHTFDGVYSGSASIFADCDNNRNFQDSNTLVYGHHMKNGTMFACIEKYESQTYYDEHPVMWLLTPEGDYLVQLFSGYTTSAYSDTYTIFRETGEELDEYIKDCLAQSDFKAKDVKFTGEDKLIVLSTCSTDYNNARYVVHGILQPVG